MLSPKPPIVNNPHPAGSPPAPVTPPAATPTTAPTRRQPDRQLGDRVRSLSLSQIPERRTTIGSLAVWLIGLVLLAGGGWYAYAHFFAAKSAEPIATQATAPGSSATGASSSKSNSSAGSSSVETPRSLSPAPAASSLAPPAKGEIALESKGYIVPAHQILVSPKVNGMIVKLNIEEGRRVAKGEVLAVLESIDYEADLARAKANVQLMKAKLAELVNGFERWEAEQAAADLGEAEAQLVQLEADYRRAEELRKRNSVTQQDFELTKSKYEAQVQRRTRLRVTLEHLRRGIRDEKKAAAAAELAQAEADVVKAEWRLGNCTIRAPISGTILKKNAEEGNIVNPIAFNGSFSLCEMADLSDLEADLNIQERDISVIQVGQKCRVRAEAYPSRVYEGFVDRLMPIADRAKGAIPVRVKIRVPADEEGIYLKPEMGAIVTFLNEHVSPAAVTTHEPAPEATADVLPVSTSP
jgi:HlyD family secretion protein